MRQRSSALDDVQDIPEAEYQDRDHQTHHQERDRLLARHCLDVLNHVYSSLMAALVEGYAERSHDTRRRERMWPTGVVLPRSSTLRRGAGWLEQRRAPPRALLSFRGGLSRALSAIAADRRLAAPFVE